MFQFQTAPDLRTLVIVVYLTHFIQAFESYTFSCFRTFSLWGEPS